MAVLWKNQSLMRPEPQTKPLNKLQTAFYTNYGAEIWVETKWEDTSVMNRWWCFVVENQPFNVKVTEESKDQTTFAAEQH